MPVPIRLSSYLLNIYVPRKLTNFFFRKLVAPRKKAGQAWSKVVSIRPDRFAWNCHVYKHSSLRKERHKVRVRKVNTCRKTQRVLSCGRTGCAWICLQTFEIIWATHWRKGIQTCWWDPFLCAMSLSSFYLFQGWCRQWWMIRRGVQSARWFQENCCVTSWNTRAYQSYILLGESRVWISVRRLVTGVQICAICFSRWRYWLAWIVS